MEFGSNTNKAHKQKQQINLLNERINNEKTKNVTETNRSICCCFSSYTDAVRAEGTCVCVAAKTTNSQ